MTTYSLDLRKRVLADCDAGLKTQAVAAQYRVSPAWVRRLKQRRRETGEVAPRPRGGHRPRRVDRPRLIRLVRQQPDATLRELRDRLGIPCALSTLWTILNPLGGMP